MKTAIVYDEGLKDYSFGEGHPLNGDRFAVFWRFFEQRFAHQRAQFEKFEPEPAKDRELELVHHKEYIRAIQSASEGKVLADILRYVSGDNLDPATGYIPRGIEKGARVVVGASLLAGELLAQKKFSRAIGIGGGLHHARPGYGEGFCFYNDIAVLIEKLKQKYNRQRILVLDTDAHAGNGTKEIFYNDPEVLFIDLHQDPATIYPGTGFISEVGSGPGEGFTVNLCLSPGTGSHSYEYLFEEIIFPLAGEFAPQMIIRYGGSDPHYLDTLTDLGLTLEGFRSIGSNVKELSDTFCQGESLDFIVSGYNLTVLPFAWSGLIAGLLDLDVDLSGLKEDSPPPRDYRLSDTKDMAGEIKKILSKFWRCMGGN